MIGIFSIGTGIFYAVCPINFVKSQILINSYVFISFYEVFHDKLSAEGCFVSDAGEELFYPKIAQKRQNERVAIFEVLFIPENSDGND